MVKGVLFLETGEVQVIGELRSAANIVAAIRQVLPELEQQEKDRDMREKLALSLTPEELEILNSIRDKQKQALIAAENTHTVAERK